MVSVSRPTALFTPKQSREPYLDLQSFVFFSQKRVVCKGQAGVNQVILEG